ncbi:MAG: aldose 1-epimerase [Actinomycetota bacterium]|nr:aldose 1-epimerase [Actinomycetota bacterium]
MIPFSPSGEQFEISCGDQKATIVEIGGGVRTYEVGGRPVLDPYPVDQICGGAHGTPLIPWPNRLDHGSFRFEGEKFQLPLTEPEQNNAIHGFLRWVPWSADVHEPDAVTMSARVAPRPGYPFSLDVSVAYRLGDEGLEVTTEIMNRGDRTCPVGHGQHPYLSAGGGLIDDCLLQHPGTVRILTGDRQLPAGRERVSGTPFDFGEPQRIEGAEIDFAFTDLVRDEAGRAWTRLEGPDGKTASIWLDESYPLVELYTGHTLAPDLARRGLGTEPMTCAPDAFNNGEGLIRLEPGGRTTATWGATLEA